MTITSSLALFLAMALSAAIPGPSVLAVVSRSLSYGLSQGLLVIFGVVMADFIFITLAISGLSAIANLLGEFAVIIKYLGVTYLFWLAYVMWTSEARSTQPKHIKTTRTSSFAIGVIMTLSNPKAILFYMGFLPAFLDLQSLTVSDAITIFVISTLSVGSVLLLYAYLAAVSSGMFKKPSASKRLNRLSASVLATCGVVLAIKN
ncbi:LysE family translocator [Vibrio sp. SCSIO 43135]|uniref:LysE family translocator n=1 Tax=Vibrio sp. SCSIO 43135 TaxID=2819096 RepID=UPI00207533D2|nr:LysE family translocator [Vibrio sp. SCSIO 43135]USD43412.1 LysE family translocator [Vibrio sp. SCSIO 43135]